MRRRIKDVLPRLLRVALAVVLVAAPFVGAQENPTQEQTAAKPFKPEELEQIVAPIALYPDPLVAQVLMAATYPLEVIQAARFVKDNANLKGDALNQALTKQSWDDSVKSLVSFPQILAMMNDKLDWMQKLGDAFLAQQKDTMDAVQRLRAKAQASGNLKTNEQQKVIVEPAEAAPAAPPPGQPPPPPQQQTVVVIEPANPQVIYVPTYNPTVVYGAWPYPAYPPYYYYPPGYVAATAAISFGVGMAVGAAVWGGCNWNHGSVNVNVNKYNSFTNNVNTVQNRNKISTTSAPGGGQQWQHNPQHRQGVQYRDPATQQKFNKGYSPSASSRDAYRGRTSAGGATGQLGAGGSGTRTSGLGGQGAGQRGGQASASGGAGQLGSGGAGTRSSGAGSQGGGQRGGQGGAFEGAGQGHNTSQISQRGQSSISSARASGFGGGQAGRGGGRR